MDELHTNRSRALQTEISREEMYRDWLGIKSPLPSYYGLLGLPELESDQTAVLHAGRHVKRKLRAYQIGLYRKQALELLAEVGQAVSVLTNPEKKRSYDSELMRQWRGAVEELYHAHCDGGPREPGALEAWLTACQGRNVPVARLIPYIMRSLYDRSGPWPAIGAHDLGLPINLWIYRDAAVLGQCLHLGSLERRVDAVKRVQKLLGIPEVLARLVAEEVCRSLHLLSHTRIVVQAKNDPEGVLLRLGRRIQRFGGQVGRGKVLAAIARLLGKHKADLDRAMARISQPPVDLSPAQVAAMAARRARQRVKHTGTRASRLRRLTADWVAGRPQILVVAATVAGSVILTLALLVATGVLDPWEPDAPPPTGLPVTTGQQAPPNGSQVSPPAQGGLVSPLTVDPAPTATGTPPEWLKKFQEKYPTNGAIWVPEQPNLPPLRIEPGTERPKITFFGVDADSRSNGSKTPAPKAPAPTPPAPPVKQPTPTTPLPKPPQPPPKEPVPKTPEPAPKEPTPPPPEPVPPQPPPTEPAPKTPEPAPKEPAPTPPEPAPPQPPPTEPAPKTPEPAPKEPAPKAPAPKEPTEPMPWPDL